MKRSIRVLHLAWVLALVAATGAAAQTVDLNGTWSATLDDPSSFAPLVCTIYLQDSSGALTIGPGSKCNDQIAGAKTLTGSGTVDTNNAVTLGGAETPTCDLGLSISAQASTGSMTGTFTCGSTARGTTFSGTFTATFIPTPTPTVTRTATPTWTATPTDTPTPTEPPDEGGFVPPDHNALRCEKLTDRLLLKLAMCITKCHLQEAARGMRGRYVDEEACEDGFNTTPPSCRDKYNADSKALTQAKICPACLDYNMRAVLADKMSYNIEAQRGLVYCAGPTPLPLPSPTP